jgi:S1-C subfamily serine protease
VFRLSLPLFLFFTFLYSDTPFRSCVEKGYDANIFQQQSVAIPVSKYQRLIYSLKKPQGVIVKHDRFLSLYLVKQANPFAYPFVTDFQLKKPLALISKDTKPLRVVKKQPQVGLNSLAHYTQMQPPYSVIMSLCCSVEGVVTPRGVIEKGYINHFLTSNTQEYGDIGIRVEQQKGKVVVQSVDPYFLNNPFYKGDIITKINRTQVKNSADCMQKILFAKTQTVLRVTIVRHNHKKNLRVVVQPRYGGGELSDTFMERFGVYFDKDLHITTLSKKFQNYGLKVGDKLIMVNGVKVSTQKGLRVYLEEFKDYSTLLFMRNNFQFFVKIK